MASVAYEKAHFGEWLAFVHSQAQWHRHLSWPWTSIGHAVSDLVHWRLLDTSTASVVELFDLVTVVLLAVAAVVAFIRIRPSYGVAPRPRLLRASSSRPSCSPRAAKSSCSSPSSPCWACGSHGTPRAGERALLFLFLPCGYFLLERFVTGKFAG